MVNKEENNDGEFIFNMMDLACVKGVKKYKICRNIDFSLAGVCACTSGSAFGSGLDPLLTGGMLVGAAALAYLGYCNQQKINMLIDFSDILQNNHEEIIEQINELDDSTQLKKKQ